MKQEALMPTVTIDTANFRNRYKISLTPYSVRKISSVTRQGLQNSAGRET